ncbi:cysteine proteinase [Hygrophoropsis aurantiaca]|uniref:Cysteine proteinase n=1 Tax=Hygrophoropsis aurantiaca TaxID=72124 RepID=A0ACB8ASP6_9AGAM|nr:cysteine proteinase [Hygrophoropsis aurantiaca]
MLASPLYPVSSFSPQHGSDDASQFRPARDLEAFNSLLPPPIEFIEGSSSGTLAVAEGKYEAINATPKATKNNHRESTRPASPTSPKTAKATATQAHPKPGSLYNGVLDVTWPPNQSVGSGLHNIGNTCFLNSALQCLLHTAPLLHVLLAHSQSDPCRVKGGFCMACSLRQVMYDSHIKRHTFTPYPITSKLHLIAKHLRKGRQEDSHEFLRYAIDALQKSCLAGYPQKIDHKLAETTWVHKIFGGRLRSRVTCRECHHNSDTFDSMLDLSLDIHGASGLRDAFRKFVSVDYLKGADMYKCEKCKKAVNAEKRFTIQDAPAVLTIHLKRFTHLGRKIGHFINYDERLSLQPVMSDGQFGPWYSLFGVICHAGGGPNSGHYYAHVKGGNGRWYQMNDEMVTPDRDAPTGMKNAYVLFYVREKGQSLEAAINRTPLIAKGGVVGGMKKRKHVEKGDDAEDIGEKTSRPFIGPLLPSPMSNETESKSPKINAQDPQADIVKKKIEAVTKVSSVTALTSLSQYNDDDDDDDDDDTADGGMPVGAKAASEPSQTPFPSSPSQAPPTSSPAPPSSITEGSNSTAHVTSTGIPASSFYGSAKKNDRKRKSPDIDDDESRKSFKHMARQLLHTPSPKHSSNGPRRKSSFGGGALNPYNRMTGSNTLHRSDTRHRPIQYGKRRRMIM